MTPRAYLPDLLVSGGRVHAGAALSVVDGSVAGVGEPEVGCQWVRLRGKAIVPGLVSAHSHAFQRVLRGRTEMRPAGHGDFWAWREAMYRAAAVLDPDDLYAAARMAFHEMSLAGITAVGEFAYLHRDPAGRPYAEPDLLHRQVVRAAREVGIRVVLLRSAYARGGPGRAPDPAQRRFLDDSPEAVVESAERLAGFAATDPGVTVGLAPHSVRACPAEWIGRLAAEARRRGWPLHVHAAEQPAEVAQCRAEHGRSPVELLHDVGALHAGTTLVHAIHVSAGDLSLLGRARVTVCACPTTERDLGDGIVPAGEILRAGGALALGSDSNLVVDLLEEARALEGHLRLQHLERGLLTTEGDVGTDDLALRLLGFATSGGMRSLGLPGGDLAPGHPADFSVVSLEDPSIAGASAGDLATQLVFSGARTAVRDVYVAGEPIVTAGASSPGRPDAVDVVGGFRRTMAKLWEAEMDLVRTLQALVAIDSTSSRSNEPVLDHLEALVRPLGFETRRMRWVDASGVEKGNLVARKGPDLPGGLALVGHTDCVPFDPEWEEALSGTLRNGTVVGRGSADTKGSVAAMLHAASRVEPVGLPLWLLFTADEEVGCQGAKALAEEGLIHPAAAIIGEPTRLVPVRAHKGYCAVDVTVHGVEGHSAFPDVGASAIHAAGRLLAEVEGIQARLAAEHSDPTFQPPFTTFNVGVIRGGKARNVLAGECFFTLEWRPLPGQPPGLALTLLDEASRRIEEGGGGKLRVERTPMRVDPAGVTPPGAAVVRFLEEESGNAATAIPFGTELPELLSLGAEACVFGPGDIRVAHRTGEFVPVSELERAAAILGRAIARFCAMD